MFAHEKALRRISGVDPSAGAATCRALLADIKRLRAYLDRQSAHIAGIAAKTNVRNHGEADTAEMIRNATGCSAGEAKRKATTAEQLDSMDSTGEALGHGDITGDHADALAALRADADDTMRAALTRDEADLVATAKSETPEQFRRTLAAWRHANSADDGIDDAEKKRLRSRLTLTKGRDGMGLVRGELDPESFEAVSRAIGNVANEIFHGAKIDQRPDMHHNNPRLMAEALVELCRRGTGASAADGRRSRATVIVSTTLDALLGRLKAAGHPTTLADGTTIPAEVARRLACDADLIPIVFGGAGQVLDVGQVRRLASGAQRAALRALYPGCAIEWCDKPFDWCDIHHLKPWETGGSTDLDNLVPLCSKHHHLVHEGGWNTERQANGTHRFHHRSETAATTRSPRPAGVRPRTQPPPGRRRQPHPEHSGPRCATLTNHQPTLIEV